jgi:hypothetical protein
MRVTACIVCLMLFFACSNTVKTQATQLSFSQFFENEISSLQSMKKQLNKRLMYNQELKQVLISKADWTHELAPFLELKFPSIAQQKDYQVMHVNLHPNAFILKLNALNKQAKYNFIQVLFVQDQIRSITVYSFVNSFTQQTSNYYRFVTGKSYRIESAYQIKTMASNKYAVEGLIVN